MVALIYLFILWILTVAFPSESMYIISDKLYLHENGNIEASGKAEVYFKNYTIKAENVLYIKSERRIVATGNVYIKAPHENLEAEGSEAEILLEDGKGYIKDVKGKYRSFYIEVENLRRVEEEKYEATEGNITTCPPEDKEAVICFSKAVITDKYVFSYNNTLRIWNIPILYSPIWIAPVGDRRSGLLEPMIGTDTYNMIIYRQPFYWAISRDKDLTLTLDYRSEQADGIELEYRQVFSSYSRLRLNAFYYKEPFPPGIWWQGREMEEFKEDRYRFKLDSNYKDLRLGFDIASDSYIIEDIYFTRERETLPYLTSYIDYHKDFNDILFTFSAKKFYDLTQPDGFKTIDRLPEIGIFMRNKKINKWLYFNSEMYYTNFYQEEGLKSHRFLFRPQLNTNIRIGKFTDYISITQINNYYLPYGGFQGEKDTLISTYEIENRIPIFWSKDWGDLKKDTIFEIVYKYQPNTYDNMQFDVFDEINRKSEIKFRISSDTYSEETTYFSLFAEGGYNYLGSYFMPTDGKLIEEKLLPLRVAMNLRPISYVSYSQDMYYDFNLKDIVRITNNLNLNYKVINSSIGYYISKSSENKVIADQLRLRIGLNYEGYFIRTYTNTDNKTKKELFRRITLGYSSPCWGISLKYRSTWDGNRKTYIDEIYLYFSIFNIKDFILPLKTR